MGQITEKDIRNIAKQIGSDQIADHEYNVDEIDEYDLVTVGIETAKSDVTKEYWFNKFLSGDIELSFNKEVHFICKGNHSIQTLEEICKYYKELIFQLRLKEQANRKEDQFTKSDIELAFDAGTYFGNQFQSLSFNNLKESNSDMQNKEDWIKENYNI